MQCLGNIFVMKYYFIYFLHNIHFLILKSKSTQTIHGNYLLLLRVMCTVELDYLFLLRVMCTVVLDYLLLLRVLCTVELDLDLF